MKSYNQYVNEQQIQPVMTNMGMSQVNMDSSIEQLQNFDQLPSLDSKILYLLCLLHKSGQISAEQKSQLKRALFDGNEQLIQGCQQILLESSQQIKESNIQQDRMEQYGWIIQTVMDRMCEQLKWFAGVLIQSNAGSEERIQQNQLGIVDNKQPMLNFTGMQNAEVQGDDKSRMRNLLQNRVGRVSQGRNVQVLHGAGDGSMKVSETRDSSLQVLPTTGIGTNNNTYLNLQTNFNNNNTGEYEDPHSPLDSILQKKKNEKITFGKDDQASSFKATRQAKNFGAGLRINTIGLSLAGNIKACNEGMSPLMERFVGNKKKAGTIQGQTQQQQQIMQTQKPQMGEHDQQSLQLDPVYDQYVQYYMRA